MTTEHTSNQIRKLVKTGMSQGKIAKQVGILAQRVSDYIKNNNLTKEFEEAVQNRKNKRIATIKNLLEQGKNNKEIAKILKVSSCLIGVLIKENLHDFYTQLKLEKNNKLITSITELLQKDKKYSEICKILLISMPTFTKIVTENYIIQKLEKQKLEKIKEYMEKGNNKTKIATLLGITIERLSRFYKMHNLDTVAETIEYDKNEKIAEKIRYLLKIGKTKTQIEHKLNISNKELNFLTKEFSIDYDNLYFESHGYYPAGKNSARVRAKLKKLCRLKNSAKNNNILFTLTFKNITWPNYCPIFGTKLKYQNKSKKQIPRSDAASFDKLDPKGCYSPENTVIISHRANTIKSTLSGSKELQKFIKVLKKVTKGEKIKQNFICNITKARQILKSVKGRVRNDGYEFDLTLDFISTILPKHCPLSGIELCYTNNVALDNSPSIDRIDNTKGYVKDNIWILSHRANTIKNNTTIEELELLYNWMLNKGL